MTPTANRKLNLKKEKKRSKLRLLTLKHHEDIIISKWTIYIEMEVPISIK